VLKCAALIPRTLHYCWFGPDPQSDLIKKCIDSWQTVMPDFQVKLWNESNSPLDNRYAAAAYRQKLWSRLSNYVRYYALYTEGGIYLDTDVEVLKSLAPFLHHNAFAGFQLQEENVDWVACGVLGAQPGHDFSRRVFDLIVKRFEEDREFCRGPEATTAVLRKMGLSRYGLQEIGDVTLYPRDYFYPYSWLEKFSPDCVREETFCVHHWMGSGLTPEPRRFPSPKQIAARLMRFTSRPA
jgi:mannosyltransferase OCH1-like enzyme